jgi:hypothetical protein
VQEARQTSVQAEAFCRKLPAKGQGRQLGLISRVKFRISVFGRAAKS